MDTIYARLRAWRWQKALELSVPSFFILSNRHLAAVAAAAPTSTDLLANCPGIGTKKLAQFGQELVELVAQAVAEGLPPGVEPIGAEPSASAAAEPEPEPAPSLSADDLHTIAGELRRDMAQRLTKRFKGRYSVHQVEEALRRLLIGA